MNISSHWGVKVLEQEALNQGRKLMYEKDGRQRCFGEQAQEMLMFGVHVYEMGKTPQNMNYKE